MMYFRHGLHGLHGYIWWTHTLKNRVNPWRVVEDSVRKNPCQKNKWMRILTHPLRGMFRPNGITCPMEHPPAPLHKGETNFCVNRYIVPKFYYLCLVIPFISLVDAVVIWKNAGTCDSKWTAICHLPSSGWKYSVLNLAFYPSFY